MKATCRGGLEGVMCVRYGEGECGYTFFFQAEDGIRDIGVTGVQTCALPILTSISTLYWLFFFYKTI